jgi:hypothetical protein
VAVVLGGSVHLQRWSDGYRSLSVGPLFLVDVAASVVLAVALFAVSDRRAVYAALALSIGALAALALSRTTGLAGFAETGLDRSAVEAVTIEVAAVALLTATLASGSGRTASAAGPSSSPGTTERGDPR